MTPDTELNIKSSILTLIAVVLVAVWSVSEINAWTVHFGWTDLHWFFDLALIIAIGLILRTGVLAFCIVSFIVRMLVL